MWRQIRSRSKLLFKNSFKDKNLKNNKTGIEKFYLFMCFGFGYLHGDLNKLGSDEKLQDYFIQYIPIRLIKKLNNKVASEIFEVLILVSII